MFSILPTLDGHLGEGRTIDHVYAPARFQAEIEGAGYAFFAHEKELLIIVDQGAIEWRWTIPEG